MTNNLTVIKFDVLKTHFGIGLNTNLATDIDEKDTDTEYVEE